MTTTESTARSHPRLASDVARSWFSLLVGAVIAFAVSFALGFLLAATGGELTRGAITASSYFIYWSVISIVLIIATTATFAHHDGETLRRWMVETMPRPGRWRRIWWALNGGGAVSWAVSLSAVSLGALLLIASNGQLRRDPLTIGSGVAVLVSSFAVIVIAYAVRYARAFASVGGIVFPGDRVPRFADFVYLSVQVMTTFSTSDVELTETEVRKLVAVHSVVAFAFNSGIVALLVGVLVSAVQ